MSSPPDPVFDNAPAPNTYITRIMPSNSPELTKFLAKNVKGSQFNSSPWTIEDVQTDTNLPPDPNIGPVTRVTVILTNPPVP